MSLSKAEDIQPKQVRHWVVEQIRSAIFEGALKPGEWLRQERLAQEYGVSQMPVREALKELQAEGLVEHVPYRGVRVVSFTPEDVEDLYAVRGYLEGMAAQAAAKTITPAELAELQALHREMQTLLPPESLAQYRQANRRFHLIIIQASRRAYLIRTLNQMWYTFPTMLWSNFTLTADRSLPERDATDVDEHAAILQALAEHDAGRAGELMREHIQSAGHNLVAVLRQIGGQDQP